MSIALIGAIASVASVVASGIFGIFLAAVKREVRKTAEDASAAREQLENDHVAAPEKTSNLRDNLDQNHEETKLMLRTLRAQLNTVVTVLTDTIGRVGRTEAEITELTGPKPGKGKHRDHE